jgi:hypothetical protein
MQKFSWLIGVMVIFLASFLIWKMAKPSSIDTTGITLYYSETCAFCQQVDGLLSAQTASEKVPISYKEIAIPEHMAGLKQAVAYCHLDSSQGIGVPFLFAEGNCYQDKAVITEYVRQKLDVDVVTEDSLSTPTSSVSASPSVK